jgi:LacI family transcriptional regulator
MRYAGTAEWHVSLDSYFVQELPWGWSGDGCISAAVHPETGDFCKSLGVPVVDMSHILPEIAAARVCPDDYTIGAIAAEYFAERRFRRFVYYSETDDPVSDERYKGFCERLAAIGNPDIYRIVPQGKRGTIGAKSDAWENKRRKIINVLKEISTPLALFCNGDRVALGAVEACRFAGIRIPEDVAVMGIGDFHLACEASPVSLSSVIVDAEEVGYRAARMLHSLMRGEVKRSESVVRLKPKGINERRSTTTLAVDNPDVAEVIHYMMEHYNNPITINDVAVAAGMSRRRLYFLFKEYVDLEPGVLLEKMRMNHARKLLLESDLKVSSVATECGYSHRVVFHRAFIRVNGISPSKYRKKHLPSQ